MRLAVTPVSARLPVVGVDAVACVAFGVPVQERLLGPHEILPDRPRWWLSRVSDVSCMTARPEWGGRYSDH